MTEFIIISRNANYWPYLLDDNAIRLIDNYIDYVSYDESEFERKYQPNLGRLGDNWNEASYDEYFQIFDFWPETISYHSLNVLYIRNNICYCEMGNCKYSTEWLSTKTYFSVDIVNFMRIFSSKEYNHDRFNIFGILKSAIKV